MTDNVINDKKAYFWLVDFARAWINKGSLPEFHEDCFIGKMRW